MMGNKRTSPPAAEDQAAPKRLASTYATILPGMRDIPSDFEDNRGGPKK